MTIAIVGAGPGLGAAVARKFGREGFAVALIARNRTKLEALEKDLAADGVTARGYVADVRDRDALARALERAAEDLGPIEAIQFSPVPGADFLKPVLETTVEDLRAAVELSILGFSAAVGQVLPGMMERGAGTILLINGASAATPNGRVAGTSTAFAGESAYGAMLHEAAAPTRGTGSRRASVAARPAVAARPTAHCGRPARRRARAGGLRRPLRLQSGRVPAGSHERRRARAHRRVRLRTIGRNRGRDPYSHDRRQPDH